MMKTSNMAVPPVIEPFQAADGRHLWDRVWRPDEPRARVVFLHGIISHGGWYRQSCAALAQAGYEVHFLDRRGSGLNPDARGDVESFQCWIDDVENYLDSLGGRLPRVLAGISWGGKLAAAVARHRPHLLDGLMLLCPGIAAKTKARRWQVAALRVTGRLGIHHRRVPIPLQAAEWFTDETAWQQFIREDPLTLRKITLRFARSDLALNEYVRGAESALRVPTLLTLAGRDRIIDNKGMRAIFDRLATDRKQLIEYPDAAHTLEFEADPQPYFQDLIAWLRESVASAGSGQSTTETRG